MRFLSLFLLISPSFAFADTFLAQIKPTDVTVFPRGAEVIRKGQITLPAGIHDIVFPDLRPNHNGEMSPSIALTGAQVISQKWQNNSKTPLKEPDHAPYKHAKEELKKARDRLDRHLDKIAAQEQIKSAAQSQIAFLSSLSQNETLPEGVDGLRELSRMIMEETLKARQTIQQAKIENRKLQQDLPDLKAALTQAQNRLDLLSPPSDAFAQLTLTVHVPQETTSDLSVKYLTENAGWKPVYDMHLDTSDTPELTIKRGALLAQETGEHWRNVNLTLSTFQLNESASPSRIFPKKLHLSSAEPYKARALDGVTYPEIAASPMMEAPVIVAEKTMNVDLSGVTAQYQFDHAMSVDSSRDFTRIALGELAFEAEITAQAVPLNDDTAYRMVSFTNTSGERLLPAKADLYIDGRLMAETFIEQIVANAETKLGFGPIHGLRLSRNILNRNEGDRGLISRSNESTERLRIDVENLTDEDWQVTLLDRVPYTEQEDLNIDWSAQPHPQTTDYEDQRGILHWDFNVESGATESIMLESRITWPDGKTVR